MLEKWMKRSAPPSSGAMKPNPFEAENHLTVPVAMKLSWSTSLERRRSRTHGPTRTSTSPTAGLTPESVDEELRPIPTAQNDLPDCHSADTRSGTSPPSAVSGPVPLASPEDARLACSAAPRPPAAIAPLGRSAHGLAAGDLPHRSGP